MTRIGKMDRLITIETFTEAQDNFGEPIKTWTTLATVWAEVVPTRGTERFVAAQTHAERTTTFRIRYRDDVTEEMRIVWESAEYDISGIVELKRQRQLEITAQATVPA